MELTLNVRKNYGTFTLEADIALTGDHTGLFGPSGSGKSTLVGMLAGLVKPDSGEIVLDGDTLFNSTRRIHQPPGKRRIALVFQQHELFQHLNVRNNLLYGYKRCAPRHRKVDFDHLVAVLNIGHLLERSIDGLSGGEKQRVAIGRAVLSNPRLLLMDEPLSALDDNLRFPIITYLKSACQEFCIPYLFISHSLLEMRLMADQVLPVTDGRVGVQTSPEQLARSRMGQSPVGYINILRLRSFRRIGDLYTYTWGENELFISAGSGQPEGMFELSSKDVILFKRHPEAISARNLLACTVVDMFRSGGRVGVELASGGERLVAEVVDQAADELGIVIGCEVYAAIKASAFRRLA
jgi:molybdate transport system ATP-binding protein